MTMFYRLFSDTETTAQFIQKFPQSIIFFVRFRFHIVFTQRTPLSQVQKPSHNAQTERKKFVKNPH